jgi:sialidase-1
MQILITIQFLLSVFTYLPAQELSRCSRPSTIFSPQIIPGYACFRIPALGISKNGVLTAISEGRIESCSDYAKINLVERQSNDGGQTWGEPFVIAAGYAHNATFLTEKYSEVMHLLYCQEYSRCYSMKSINEGASWTAPIEITNSFNGVEYPWEVIAIGPGHGIQLDNGRLIAPYWMSSSRENQTPSAVSTLYSDNNGESWQSGEIVWQSTDPSENPMEPVVVQLSSGNVMLNIRRSSRTTETSFDNTNYRAVAVSANGSTGWQLSKMDVNLSDPGCFGSINRLNTATMLFQNATNGASVFRAPLGVRYSTDDGLTWSEGKIIEPLQGGYSEINTFGSNIYSLYERGWLNSSFPGMFEIQSIDFLAYNFNWLVSPDGIPKRKNIQLLLNKMSGR